MYKTLQHSAYVDTEKYQKFLRHECEYKHRNDIDGKISYSYLPTSKGTKIKVKCICGIKKDITLKLD